MFPHEYFRLMAQFMRYHEHLATKCERGSTQRQYHEDRAQQYKDEILGNNPRNSRPKEKAAEEK